MKTETIPHSRPWIIKADQAAVADVLATGMIAKGEKVWEFEYQMTAYLGVNYAIAQGSGTAALILALKTLQMAKGDEVILPTYVCRSVLEAVLSVGVTPVLCDVNEMGVITEHTVAPHINQNTKAIIAVHIFGHPCDVRALSRTGIVIIEDACQSFGLTINGEMAGALGDIGVLSFHATKCLTTGEGGMVVTRNAAMAERARALTEGQLQPTARNVSPLSDLQAALGIAQLARYSSFLTRRKALQKQLVEAATGFGLKLGIPNDSNALFRFTIRGQDHFDIQQARFLERGIYVRRGVDELLHRYLRLGDQHFPMAVGLYESTVSVPFYPSLSDAEVSTLCKAFSLFSYAD